MTDNPAHKKEKFMLTDLQKKQVAAWVAEGLSLAQIQTKINDELNIPMTYMDVRFLVDDLDLELQDSAPSSVPQETEKPAEDANTKPEAAASVPAPGEVSLSVDAVQIPGVIASGDVTFSDGVRGKWLIDQSGRPGLAEFPEGYRPPQADVPVFQQKLVAELRKLGLA